MSGAYAVICKVFHRLIPAYRSPGWLADTFTDSNDAEDALCRDRSGFLRKIQMGLIPRPIWSRFVNFGPTAHIEGFQNFFDYMNTEPAADELRQLVVNYFNDVRYLQPLLLPPLSRLYSHFMMYPLIRRTFKFIQDIMALWHRPSRKVQDLRNISVRFQNCSTAPE
jgi:hypothetical protein